MEKNIWVLDNQKEELIEAQRLINEGGGMRAFCMRSFESVKKAYERHLANPQATNMPSLIILDYDSQVEEEFQALNMIKQQPEYAGVPLFFMVSVKSKDLDEECYEKGATVVLPKPFSRASILRIERTAWQYEMTRNYEKVLQKQANELAAAKKIKQLNQQLETRNQLLHHIFGRYFSDEVLELILDNPEGAAVGGVKERITVMMADLRGFTSISENLSPEIVTDMLNHFLGEMTEVIMNYGGTVIEFIGDAILAVFGAPVKREHSEDDAVAAAITMQNQMAKVNKYNKENNYPFIEMGIGIHNGEVFLGNIGSEKMMRYNVIGQAVNLCSRIESYSVGGQVLISKETMKRMYSPVGINKTFSITTKGIAETVPVCEIIGIGGSYRCYIEKDEPDILYQPTEEIQLYVYEVQGKKVSKVPVMAQLIQCSKKRARILLNSSDGVGMYANVELRGKKKEEELFSNVYAKVIARQDAFVMLYFTYTTKEFLSYLQRQIQETDEV